MIIEGDGQRNELGIITGNDLHRSQPMDYIINTPTKVDGHRYRFSAPPVLNESAHYMDVEISRASVRGTPMRNTDGFFKSHVSYQSVDGKRD